MRITAVSSFVAVVCASPALMFAQVPPNDLCTNATTVSSLPFSEGGLDWASATHDIDVGCNQMSGFPTKYGVWYTYTPASSHDIQVLANTSECRPNVAAIFTGSCPSPTELACAQSRPLHYSLTAGTTYRILIGDYYNVIAGPPSGTIGATLRVPPAPPANDQCSGATVVSTVPFTDPGVDYTTAVSDIDVTCNEVGQTGHGFWYTITPATSGVLHESRSFQTCGENTVAALFAGSECGSLVEQGCARYNDGLWQVAGGTQYWILVGDTYNNDPSYPIDVAIELLPPFSNDHCAGAATIPALPFGASDVPIGAAAPDLDVSCNNVADLETGAGVWYTYNPATDHLLGIDHWGHDGSTIAAVFTGICGNLTEIACGTWGRLNHPVKAGETYYILLGGESVTNPPTFADIDVVEAPANDDCSDAKVIPTASYSESLDTSTASYAYSDPEAGCGVEDTEASVWYAFMTTESGAVTVSTCGSDYDTVVSAYTSSCLDVSAQMVTCNDDDGFSCSGAQGSMLFGATAGVQYWIQVAEPESDTKATKASALGGQLEFSFESTVPVTDPWLVFSDGFESGNTDPWSTTIP